jgi:thioredoxin-related protein
MPKYLLGALFACLSFFIACSGENEKSTSAEDEDCVSPIKDPNDVKPMALMMRTMANYCDSMRLEINAGRQVDSIKYPLMPFWTAEPTDSSVLETLYFNNAKQFAAAYRELMSSTGQQQAEKYTAVINSCIHCHSSYCSGPLKRIRKLTLDYKAK